MAWDNVYPISKELELASQDEVASAEQYLGTSFPQGYREYVTQLGHGLFNGFVRIFMPSRIVAELNAEFRQRWKEFFCWDGSDAKLSDAQVFESIIVGDTQQGDELIFHPNRTDQIFLLPRHSNGLPQIGHNFNEAISWLFGPYGVHEPVKHLTFQPTRSRGVHYRYVDPTIKHSEVRALILEHVNEFLVEYDLDGVPNKKRIPQNRMMIFAAKFAAQLTLYQDILQKRRAIECTITYDGSETSKIRDELLTRLEEIGFEVVDRL